MNQESLSSTFVIKNALLASKLSKRVGNGLSAHGLSLTEFLVMHYLDKSSHKAVSRIELAEHIGLSASGITRLIAPMEKNKILQKEANPRDARQSLVKLTKTGLGLYGEAKTSFDHIANELVSNLSQTQQEKMLELYAKVI